MGDVLHGLPAVAGLRRAWPECSIGWAVEPRWAPLLVDGKGAGPVVDWVHPVKTREWKRRPFAPATAGELAGLRRDLRERQYDVCVDLQGAIKSAVIGKMAGAQRFVGMRMPREGAARLLYGEQVECREAHVIGQACELVSAAVGLAVAAEPVALPMDAAAEGWCTATLARLGVVEGFVLLAPGAGWGAKQWGVDRYGELTGRLRAAGFQVLVNAAGPEGGADAELAEHVAKLGGGTAVRSSVAQLVALTRRAALVVGGDTGPVHLGAALGRPVVGLFGPTDPKRNGPEFPVVEEDRARVVVLRNEASVTDHRRASATEAGLGRITVDQVEAAACALLGERHG